jgi:uncharacterized Zn finger protein
VSELSKRASAKPCPRCKAPMEEVLRIAPAQTDPGLIAYECPSCGCVTSDLTPSNSQPPGRHTVQRKRK